MNNIAKKHVTNSSNEPENFNGILGGSSKIELMS